MRGGKQGIVNFFQELDDRKKARGSSEKNKKKVPGLDEAESSSTNLRPGVGAITVKGTSEEG